MISFWRTRLFRETWHPSFEELMLYLDGEVGAATDRVGTHTKNCWSCRLRLEKIDHAIREFMEARNASFGESPTLPAHRLPQFAARLEQLEAECGSTSRCSTLWRECGGLAGPRWSPKAAVLVASLGLLAVIFWRLNHTQPVSAKEILSHIREAETWQMDKVSAPVIYEKLQLRRTSQRHLDTVTWEVWNDARNRRLRRRVKGDATATGGPLLEDFTELLRSHRADSSRLLSADNYEVWRTSIGGKSEEVVEGTLAGGQRAAILKLTGRGPFSKGAIVSTEFTVREKDWHPVGQRWLVQRLNEVVDYSLGEVAYDVMALATIPASIFDEPRPPRVRASYTPVRRLMPTLVHMDLWPADDDLLPSEADLTAAEVEARYALHSVRACVGRPIEARLSTGGIDVAGVVDTPERKEAILLALRGIPHVRAAIRTVAEDSETAERATADVPADGGAQESKLAVEALLRGYFANGKCTGMHTERQSTCAQQEIAGLSREALARAEAAQSHAWALRRLVEWGPFLSRSELRTSSRRLLDVMLRDHLEALRGELQQWRARLKPVLSALTRDGAPAKKTDPLEAQEPQGDGITGSLLRLCTAVEDAANLTMGTFAETNRPVTRPEQAMGALLAALDGVTRDFPKLEADLGVELSGLPRTPVSQEKAEGK